jgi:NADH-quinone oxidoreductase subunit L
MTPTLNLWLIPVLPLAGAAINGFWGKKSSRTAVSTVALVFSGAALVWALTSVLRYLPSDAPYQEYLAHWIRSSNGPGTFAVDFAFYLDQLSAVMLLVVTGVGFLIHIYSVGYMRDDPICSCFSC